MARELIVQRAQSHREAIFESCGDLELTLERDARCEVLICGGGSGKLSATIHRGAYLKVTIVEVGDEDLGREFNIDLIEQGAECHLGGVSLLSGDRNVNVISNMRHSAENCRSEQNFRAVATDNSISRFSGLIYVARDAQQTVALQQSDNVTLSSTAKVFTDPQLEIYADDVKCNHGATVGKRNEEALFYMRQRGIAERDAQSLLLESFCYGVIELDGFDEDTIERVHSEIECAVKKL